MKQIKSNLPVKTIYIFRFGLPNHFLFPSGLLTNPELQFSKKTQANG